MGPSPTSSAEAHGTRPARGWSRSARAAGARGSRAGPPRLRTSRPSSPRCAFRAETPACGSAGTVAVRREASLLRSTEGVGAESHTVAKVAQGGMFEESRGRGGAALCAGKQAGLWRRGASGAARFTRADATCDETMEVWQASRRQAWRRQAWRRQPWRRQPWRRQAWHAGPEADAEHLGWCRVEG